MLLEFQEFCGPFPTDFCSKRFPSIFKGLKSPRENYFVFPLDSGFVFVYGYNEQNGLFSCLEYIGSILLSSHFCRSRQGPLSSRASSTSHFLSGFLKYEPYFLSVQAGLCEAEQEQMRKILYQKESNYNRLKRAKMDKSMFVKIKTLGIGAFGEVCLACKVDTHALYAMKTLRKKDVLNRNQVAHVKAERDILAEADNEWVVKLYYSFQDKDSLYFVMDYIPGGDMMSLLIRMEIFPEHLARFYIAELTLAIESVHKMGFIHRDIKPDNILIDLDGHIKLTDFGLCTGFRWTHNSKYYQKGTVVDIPYLLCTSRHN